MKNFNIYGTNIWFFYWPTWLLLFGWIKGFAGFWYMLVCSVYILWPKQFNQCSIPAVVDSIMKLWCWHIVHCFTLSVIWKQNIWMCNLFGNLCFTVFTNGLGELGSIPGRVIPKTKKMVLDAILFNTQHYKVWIKSKVKQSRERSNALPYYLL